MRSDRQIGRAIVGHARDAYPDLTPSLALSRHYSDASQTGQETPERRARRLFDEMARNIGREAVNYMKIMYPKTFEGQPKTAELSMVNHIRNDINYRMKPMLMAMIAMQKEWQAEAEAEQP